MLSKCQFCKFRDIIRSLKKWALAKLRGQLSICEAACQLFLLAPILLLAALFHLQLKQGSVAADGETPPMGVHLGNTGNSSWGFLQSLAIGKDLWGFEWVDQLIGWLVGRVSFYFVFMFFFHRKKAFSTGMMEQHILNICVLGRGSSDTENFQLLNEIHDAERQLLQAALYEVAR